MKKDKVILPTKEEVKKMLVYIIDHDIYQGETIGELLGLKFTDSLLPKMKFEPEWGYEGLKEFCINYGIQSSDTFPEALNKLK